ncbi:hypothetical protein DRJ12_03965 [Candidatus Acetothermia bacterium]|nr:MAG: hypothetical protein DRJ12_03965 [Candidatus Acetothermia bacterium]
MKKRFSLVGFMVLCVAAAGFITLAFFIGSWTGSSGKVSVTGAFAAVPAAITGTASNIEYKVSVPSTDATLAGVTVDFSSPSKYVTFNPASGSVTTDSDGVARIEIVAKANAPTWITTTTIEAACTIGNVKMSGKTEPLSLKAG